MVAFGYHQSMRIEELLEEEYARDSLFAEWVKSSEEKLIVTDVAYQHRDMRGRTSSCPLR